MNYLISISLTILAFLTGVFGALWLSKRFTTLYNASKRSKAYELLEKENDLLLVETEDLKAQNELLKQQNWQLDRDVQIHKKNVDRLLEKVNERDESIKKLEQHIEDLDARQQKFMSFLMRTLWKNGVDYEEIINELPFLKDVIDKKHNK